MLNEWNAPVDGKKKQKEQNKLITFQISLSVFNTSYLNEIEILKCIKTNFVNNHANREIQSGLVMVK